MATFLRPFITFVCLALALSMLAPGVARAADEPSETSYSDVTDGHWARNAVHYTAVRRDWLRFGGSRFRPEAPLRRWQLARAALRAFAPPMPVDPDISFTDVLPGTTKFLYANKAVSLGWFPPNAAFDPDGLVNKRLLSRVLVLALGLRDEARSLNRISTEDGRRLKVPSHFGYLVLANELHLHRNFSSPNDRRDLLPWEKVNRGYAAIAFKRAAQVGWQLWSAKGFTGITLPRMTERRREVVEFALRFAGYPYIYAAEWHRRTGGQPKGGFDCSGFQWWVAKKPGGGFDNTHVRPYRGWSVNARRASLIAREAPRERRVRYPDLVPGDLLFFATGDMQGNWRDIDHGGVALGNGWMIHSSGSRAGVTVSRMGDGWWRDAFVMGRRMFGRSPSA